MMFRVTTSNDPVPVPPRDACRSPVLNRVKLLSSSTMPISTALNRIKSDVVVDNHRLWDAVGEMGAERKAPSDSNLNWNGRRWSGPGIKIIKCHSLTCHAHKFTIYRHKHN